MKALISAALVAAALSVAQTASAAGSVPLPLPAPPPPGAPVSSTLRDAMNAIERAAATNPAAAQNAAFSYNAAIEQYRAHQYDRARASALMAISQSAAPPMPVTPARAPIVAPAFPGPRYYIIPDEVPATADNAQRYVDLAHRAMANCAALATATAEYRGGSRRTGRGKQYRVAMAASRNIVDDCARVIEREAVVVRRFRGNGAACGWLRSCRRTSGSGRYHFSYSISGGSASRTVDAGIATWFKEHGDTVNGRKIVLVRRDDGGMSPDNARRLAQDLIVNEHADLLAGITFHAQRHCGRGRFDCGQGAASDHECRHVEHHVQRSVRDALRLHDRADHRAAGQVDVVQNGVKTAISMYQDYGPGIEAGSAFNAAYAAAGGSVVDEIKIPVDNLDYSAYVQRIKDAHPQGVFVFINASGDGMQFVKAAHSAGLDKLGIRIFTPSDIVDDNDLDALGDSAVGLMAASNYTTTHDSALNRRFVADFREAYAAQNGGASREATEVGVAAYDIMHAISLVVAAQPGAIDADKAMQTMCGMKFESPRGPIAIDPDTRDIVQNVYMRRAQRVGGKVHYVEIATFPLVKDPIEK